MDKGADSYRRFLEGDNEGIVEIIREYNDKSVADKQSFTGEITPPDDSAVAHKRAIEEN